MGSWSTSIMGGDEPLDIEFVFEQVFDEETPTSETGLDFLQTTLLERDFAAHVVKQVTAFLIMRAGAPMHEEVRRLALEGVAEEDVSDWRDPDKRREVLTAFGRLVEQYPAEGGRVDLPDQPGLFDTILG